MCVCVCVYVCITTLENAFRVHVISNWVKYVIVFILYKSVTRPLRGARRRQKDLVENPRDSHYNMHLSSLSMKTCLENVQSMLK